MSRKDSSDSDSNWPFPQKKKIPEQLEPEPPIFADVYFMLKENFINVMPLSDDEKHRVSADICSIFKITHFDSMIEPLYHGTPKVQIVFIGRYLLEVAESFVFKVNVLLTHTKIKTKMFPVQLR